MLQAQFSEEEKEVVSSLRDRPWCDWRCDVGSHRHELWPPRASIRYRVGRVMR